MLQYLQFYSYKLNGKSENEIVALLKADSALALYRQLARDGFPVCLECGATPVTTALCEACSEDRKQKARNVGEAVELPSAGEAKELLRKPIEDLLRAVDQLDERVEHLKGGQFVAYYVGEEDWPLPSPPGGIVGPVKRFHLLGGHASPPEPLTTLIAVYALMGRPLKPLVAALHHEPSRVDLGDLEERVEGADRSLRNIAEITARQVRGGEVGRTGRGARPTSPEQHTVAWLIQDIVSRNQTREVSDIYIQTSLERLGYKLSQDEIARLRKLRFPGAQ